MQHRCFSKWPMWGRKVQNEAQPLQNAPPHSAQWWLAWGARQGAGKGRLAAAEDNPICL